MKFDFLEGLRKPDGTLKRFTKVSSIRYPGGKTKAISLLTQYLPDELPDTIISPFFGGGSLEIAWANNLNIKVIGCDIFWPLTNFWEHQLNEPDMLADELMTYKVTKDEFDKKRLVLKSWYEGDTKLTDLQAAGHYFYNMALSYGPLFIGWTHEIYMNNPDRYYNKPVEFVRNFRAPNLTVKNISFAESLKQDGYVYADPPYLLGYDSDVFRPMYPNQKGEHHKHFDHELFRDMMLERNDDWMISYNDCGTIRKWYDQYEFQYPKWQYSLQQGETRKGGEKGALDSRKNSKEILIIKGKYSLRKETSLERLFI